MVHHVITGVTESLLTCISLLQHNYYLTWQFSLEHGVFCPLKIRSWMHIYRIVSHEICPLWWWWSTDRVHTCHWHWCVPWEGPGVHIGASNYLLITQWTTFSHFTIYYTFCWDVRLCHSRVWWNPHIIIRPHGSDSISWSRTIFWNPHDISVNASRSGNCRLMLESPHLTAS